MSKKKPLVEDATPENQPEETIIIPTPDETPAVSDPLPGGDVQDPTRNPDTVEGSVFPQVPGEAKDANKTPDEGPDLGIDEDLKNEMAAMAEGSSEPTADELVNMVDQLLLDFKGQNKLDVIQHIEQVIKRHKSRM